MIKDHCEKCGFKPKNPYKTLYYSAMFEQTQCIDGSACKKRAAKQAKQSPTN